MTLIVVGALNSFGTDEQKEELLGGVAQERQLPRDRDVGARRGIGRRRAQDARPSRENGEYVLNGSKMWISYAREASHVLIVCRTQEGSTEARGPVDDLRARATPRA